ncbi:unnamed protein product [Moneuplotes crassus]|uniref:Uncharacterized protein n=1 Tax=Euplotes crassus TaxID=5936 RepID=A0AAD2D7A4_EUPCR|nr:unnamed protein product [Moneuplotes crassus]
MCILIISNFNLNLPICSCYDLLCVMNNFKSIKRCSCFGFYLIFPSCDFSQAISICLYVAESSHHHFLLIFLN